MRKLDWEKLREATDILVKSLRRVVVVILFGSRARGDWGPWSDYDILIVADFEEPYLDRLRKVLEILSTIPLPIEPHPYTLKEAIEMLRRGSLTIIDALEEGIVLYRGEGFEILVNEYEKLKKAGLRKSYTSIVLPRS